MDARLLAHVLTPRVILDSLIYPLDLVLVCPRGSWGASLDLDRAPREMAGFVVDEESRGLVVRVCLQDSGVAGTIGDGEVVLGWTGERLLRC